MSESQTPMTDAATRDAQSSAPWVYVTASFARELESELTATRARLAELEEDKTKMVLDFAAALKSAVRSMLDHQRNSLQRNVRIADLTSRLAELEGIAERLYEAIETSKAHGIFPLPSAIKAYEAYKEGKK